MRKIGDKVLVEGKPATIKATVKDYASKKIKYEVLEFPGQFEKLEDFVEAKPQEIKKSFPISKKQKFAQSLIDSENDN